MSTSINIVATSMADALAQLKAAREADPDFKKLAESSTDPMTTQYYIDMHNAITKLKSEGATFATAMQNDAVKKIIAQAKNQPAGLLIDDARGSCMGYSRTTFSSTSSSSSSSKLRIGRRR